MRCCLALTILLLVSSNTGSKGQPSVQVENSFGAISGHVFDAVDHRPISGAKVIALRTGPIVGIAPQAMTDHDGAFLLLHVPSGKNVILATKPEDGYPDAGYAGLGDGDHQSLEVNVLANQTVDSTAILLTKGIILKGTVLDAGSGKALPGAMISVSRSRQPDRHLDTLADIRGRFRVVVPAVPLDIQISASGYKPWGKSVESMLTQDLAGTRELLITLESLSAQPPQ